MPVGIHARHGVISLRSCKTLFKNNKILHQNLFKRLFSSLPQDVPLEEERLPNYREEEYFPVNIGDVYNDKYRVIGKLGYGAYSTSWLCRDLEEQRYACVKVSTFLPKHPHVTDREFKIYEHLANGTWTLPGAALIRYLYDEFELRGLFGKHRCLVHPAMHMTFLELIRLNSQPPGLALLKKTLYRLLHALDFLHSEANIIHLDLKTNNLMLTIEDDSILDKFAEEEANNPSPRKKIDETRTIYLSREFCRPKNYGLPILCDLGEAKIGKTHESYPFVQPYIYRAPEVIFEIPFDSSADIWNVGALIWDLFEDCHLFGDIFDDDRRHDPFKHLALMIALIGPPPPEFLQRSEITGKCFDPNGAWILEKAYEVPPVSLESRETRLSGDEKMEFLCFVRSMLQWLPEKRKTAKELLEDPWLSQE